MGAAHGAGEGEGRTLGAEASPRGVGVRDLLCRAEPAREWKGLLDPEDEA